MNGLMYFTSVPLPPHYHLVYSIPKEILSFHNKLPRRIPLVLSRGRRGGGYIYALGIVHLKHNKQESTLVVVSTYLNLPSFIEFF